MEKEKKIPKLSELENILRTSRIIDYAISHQVNLIRQIGVRLIKKD